MMAGGFSVDSAVFIFTWLSWLWFIYGALLDG